MLFGRERELATLNKLYRSEQFASLVLYDRRCVRKTALIGRFVDDKDAISGIALCWKIIQLSPAELPTWPISVSSYI